MNQRTMWAACGVAILGALLLLGLERVSRHRVSEPVVPQVAAMEIGNGVVESARQGEVSRASATMLSIVVLDEATSEPLTNATATWVRQETTHQTLQELPVGHAGEGGILRLEAVPERALLVRALGHVPRFADPGLEAQEVRLQKSAKVTVSTIDASGRPLPGVLCVLAPRSISEIASMEIARGIGHPSAPWPMWVQVTDAGGSAVIDELPPGAYYLNAMHESCIPADERGANGLFELPVGETRIALTMESLQAVVFSCPSESPVASLSWHVRFREMVTEPRVVRRLGLARAYLMDKFPGAHVFVHRPARETPESMQIGLSLVLENSTHWTGRWAMAPVDTIEVPTFLELYAGPVRTVKVRMVDDTGREYKGVPLGVRDEAGDLAFRMQSGKSVTLPYGKYKLSSNVLDMSVLRELMSKEWVVDAMSPPELLITIGEPLAKLEIHIHTPNQRLLGVLRGRFDIDGRGGRSFGNYRPEQGPIEYWGPGKQVAVQVRGVGYHDVEVPLTDLDPDRPTRIEVHMVEN